MGRAARKICAASMVFWLICDNRRQLLRRHKRLHIGFGFHQNCSQICLQRILVWCIHIHIAVHPHVPVRHSSKQDNRGQRGQRHGQIDAEQHLRLICAINDSRFLYLVGDPPEEVHHQNHIRNIHRPRQRQRQMELMSPSLLMTM